MDEQLGAAAPRALSALTDGQVRDLTDSVRDARHRQAAELAAAGDRALRHIPKLLRGPVRKVVGS
ncbi:MAG TPA: hypothetical protein VGI87_03505 [Solirubrobacteraceae bacterium]